MENLQSPLAKLYQWEETTPHKIFMVQPHQGAWHKFTWQQTADEVRRLAAVLQSYNLPPGSRIGLVSKNCAHWIMADLAIMMAGHESIPIYPNAGAETLHYILKHSEVKVLFVGKLDDWNFMKAGVPAGVQCISFPWYGPRQDGFEYWEELTPKHAPITGRPDREMKDVMSIIYTSGTTGVPKGVIHTFESFAWAVATGIQFFGFKENEAKLFSYLPMSHIAERLVTEMAGIYANSEIWFAESLDLFVKNLSEAQPTLFFAVPRIWTKFQMAILSKMPQGRLSLLLKIPVVNNLIRKKIKTGLGLQNCNNFLSGSAPISPSLVSWWSKLGVDIDEVYGMTENCAISTATKKGAFKPGTQGKVMPGAEIKISDVGEILVKVPCNMLGYYREPELTAATLQNEWLHTGDRGVFDTDGYLRITGRVKELFKTDKGKYVSPAPIEMKICKNHYVEQVCVTGSNLPQPIALLVLSADGKTKGRDYIAQSLAKTLELINPELEKHERLHKAVILKDDWTIENGLLTPTLKIKRTPIEDKFQACYSAWYEQKEVVVFEV